MQAHSSFLQVATVQSLGLQASLGSRRPGGVRGSQDSRARDRAASSELRGLPTTLVLPLRRIC